MQYFEINDSGDFIRVEVNKPIYSKANLKGEENWLDSSVFFRVGEFSGKFKVYLIPLDFSIFRKELESLYNKLNGKATFNSLEGQLKIQLIGDGIGHIEANCILVDTANNKLICKINFDQTQIPYLINQLDNILKEYNTSY